jgi:hypothetical protein
MTVQSTLLGEARSAGEPQRYHAFDSLRAAMMLLGLVLHSAMAYVTLNAASRRFAAFGAPKQRVS